MYGLIVAAGIFIAAWYAEQEAKINGVDTETVWSILAWVLIFGIIGARIFHVIDFWPYYSEDPWLILQIYRGGLGIFGGIFGGLIGLSLYSLKNKLSLNEILKFLDLAFSALPLGQFVGRWANFFNQEVYGLPSKLPWAIYIPEAKRFSQFVRFETYHPLFLYESIGCLVIFLVLFTLKHKFKTRVKLLDGDIFLMYLFTYGLLRLALEPLRIIRFEVYNFSVVSAISTILILASFFTLLLRKEGKKKA
ncbi:prolipoprotein diacylglyceryl transferase [candidate division WWE3 bacterium RIFCSPHIGHO2_01_FULL_40_23]|uniref:Phosphatidylglycerol--prolipoprotein diacylglyceryl transferase n=1 Tax=candidate division WWE3 bacterium RIFCSPLOWO2_01_FULL_41_18 TaxID=1802625 RepID=A0A1F4VFM3_UNCKA|nr:MAG: prolipoprotein diacylglyceryl transferase [candidate division WWE3 bacterium RIFCSPHIGHO2_01_FULL_40_23]OGC55750.1 MAG: prolipoprotein diacylglyceryl transferase [candidate division WWE3 bacterium RIFCSPLOWO2_01_FULL_41_18]